MVYDAYLVYGCGVYVHNMIISGGPLYSVRAAGGATAETGRSGDGLVIGRKDGRTEGQKDGRRRAQGKCHSEGPVSRTSRSHPY